jgi:hypothetical protein
VEPRRVPSGVRSHLGCVCGGNTAVTPRYFIDTGTLLGAIRHGGFISPEDREDVDLGILRESEPRLREIQHLTWERCGFPMIHRRCGEAAGWTVRGKGGLPLRYASICVLRKCGRDSRGARVHGLHTPPLPRTAVCRVHVCLRLVCSFPW